MPAQKKKNKSSLKNQTQGVVERQEPSKEDVVPEKEIFSWTAPARPFKRRNREYYITLIAMAAVVGLVIFFVEGVMPVLLIIALVFLFYVLNTVEPEIIKYAITNKGVKIAQGRTDWQFITRFWFTKRYDSSLLVFETVRIPGRLELVVNKSDKEKIKKAISKYVSEEEISPSRIDKLTNWVSKRMPGN